MPIKQAERRRREIMADIAKIGDLPTRQPRYTRHPFGAPPAAGAVSARSPTVSTGPHLSWTRKVGAKTVTRNLDAEQVERYQPLVR